MWLRYVVENINIFSRGAIIFVVVKSRLWSEIATCVTLGISRGNGHHSTVYHVPLPSTSEQAPMSSGPTSTQRPRHHLRPSIRARVQPQLGGPDVTTRATNKPNPPWHWKPLEDSSCITQRGDSRNYHIRFQLAWIEQIKRLQLANQVVTTNKSNCYNCGQSPRLNSFSKLSSGINTSPSTMREM